MPKFQLADHIQKSQPPAPRDIEVITGEILDAKRTGGEAILTIGNRLIEAKALLSHGEWLRWLAERVEFSESTAQRFMRLAREWSNPSTLTDLGASKALQLLALPESERDVFLSETHEVNGEEKTVIDMSARELAQAIKERDAALKAAEQAKADQSAAEQAREKMSQDMVLANERIAGLNAQIEEQYAQGKKWQKEIARLEVDLAKSKSRPVEVAVQADEAAVEAARKEAETQMQAELDKAKKAQAKAEKARKAAEDAKADIQKDLERAQAESKALREQAEAAQKKAVIAADPDMVLLSEMYDQTQTLIKRMGGVRLKKQNKEPEKAERVHNALMALMPLVKEAAGQ